MSPPPKSPPPRRRWWRRVLGIGLALVVVAAVALPWWLPPLVVRIAAGQGVAIGSWRSAGWSGAEYRDIVYTRDAVRVSVDALRVPVLVLRPRGGPGTADIQVGQVEVRVDGREDRARSPSPGVAPILRSVEEAWATLARWLPPTRVERVTILVEGETMLVDSLIWDGTSLQATARSPEREIEGVASIVRSGAGSFALHARVPARELTIEATVGGRGDSGATVQGTVTWRGNSADVQADFSPTGLVPAAASLVAEEIEVPSSDVGLSGYGPVRGSVRLAWSRDAYTLALAARAEPQEGSTWPVVAADVRAAGDFERVRIEAVTVDLPSWRASLSQPIEYVVGRGLSGEPAEFAIDGELAAIPALEARGRVAGAARVRPTDDGGADVAFNVEGESLGWRELEGVKLALAGRWRQPEFVIETGFVEIGPDARSEVALQADLEQRRVLSARLRGVVPAALVRAISPDLPPVERLEVEATAEGPWETLDHRGRLSFSELEWTPGRRIGGHAEWTVLAGEANVAGELALAGGGTLPFSCRGQREVSGALSGTLDRLRWVDDTGEWWRLAAPVTARYEPLNNLLEIAPWRLAGDGFEIAGEGRVRWPAVGDVALSVSGLEGQRFGGLLPEAVRGSRIEHLHVRAQWDRGPARLDGGVRATYTPVEGATYAVEAEFGTQESDLTFASVRVSDSSGVVLRGVGRLPVVVEGREDGFRADLQRDGALALELESEPNPVFWKSIADLTGWTIDEPRLSCRLGGTLAAPRGEATFAAATLRPPEIQLGGGGRLPELTGLHVKLAADDAGLSIAEGMVAIDNRWVTLTGRAPWDVWSRWRESGAMAWRSATFKLASNPLPIAIASRVFPSELAPVGEVSIEVSHDPEQGLGGRIWLHSAALRPIGPLGSIRDIHCEMDFEGYRAHLQRLEGLLGGQAVRITGDADVTDPEAWEFGLKLTSSRVPLVRRAGLIVRAELDLELAKIRARPVRVSGRVDFGPSLYSADLVELLPGGVDSPETRPPYFSVQEKPFADWEIDIAAHGEAFLRLTTPFYKDVLSADVRLLGTLEEPRVEGWVWGTGGVVVFPFGSLPVEQVLVTFTRDNPFEPRLIVSGEGRVMGYDIRMEASGSANEPRLLFTSDPPLTSQQVFLMLTTGAVPDESHTIGSSDRASRLAMFLGRNLAAGLGLGGGGGGGEERLRIRSGEDFTREGRETVLVQYDLDGRWSIVGEYDRFDAYNGGLKFRLIDR